MDTQARYELTFETWRFQVDSYWQRSSYFAAFETAALAGVWEVLVSRHWYTALVFSILGMALTRAWFLNNRKMHSYVRYWWEALGKMEDHLEPAASGGSGSKWAHPKLISDYDQNAAEMKIDRCACVSYASLIQRIPKVFAIAWAWFVLQSVVFSACSLLLSARTICPR
jgi:hypothetical protein